MSDERVYLNGELVSADEARVSAFDSGLQHGVSLFETMRAYDGVVFRLDAHMARLQRSAGVLSMTVPEAFESWRQGVADVLGANGLREARVRLTVTAGDARAVARDDDAGVQPTVLISAGPMAGYPAEAYERGMTVLISGFKQSPDDPIAGHKTGCYLPRLIALREAQTHGCAEALWFTTGHLLAEGCISNVFLVKDGVVKTPPLDTPVLPGITRNVVLDLAVRDGVAAEEAPLTIEDLLAADEVFLTNSIMEVMPVCRIERHAVGNEKPGAVTTALADAYQEQVAVDTRQR